VYVLRLQFTTQWVWSMARGKMERIFSHTWSPQQSYTKHHSSLLTDRQYHYYPQAHGRMEVKQLCSDFLEEMRKTTM